MKESELIPGEERETGVHRDCRTHRQNCRYGKYPHMTPSTRRPVSVESVFLLPSCGSLRSSRAASVAILPSALFFLRFSLGASWASSFQQVLLPDNRPWLPFLRRELGQQLGAVT